VDQFIGVDHSIPADRLCVNGWLSTTPCRKKKKQCARLLGMIDLTDVLRHVGWR
jgi:hypothetical protein